MDQPTYFCNGGTVQYVFLNAGTKF